MFISYTTFVEDKYVYGPIHVEKCGEKRMVGLQVIYCRKTKTNWGWSNPSEGQVGAGPSQVKDKLVLVQDK